MKKTTLLLFINILFAITAAAQWQPSASWPFIFEHFQTASITTTSGKIIKAKANVHIGHSALWYESGSRRLQAKEGTVSSARFSDGTVFYNIENQMCQVIRQDTVNGDIRRIYRRTYIDMDQFNEMAKSANGGTLDGMGRALNNFSIEVATTNSAEYQDLNQRPIPRKNKYYILASGNTFEAGTVSILKNIPKERRKEYMAYTRNAEIISSNESSIVSVYEDFFLK